MVDASVAAMKLTELSRRIERVRALCPASAEDLTGDALDLVSFNSSSPSRPASTSRPT